MNIDKKEIGICLNTLIPLRAINSETAELVNQILFGELYSIQEAKGKWTRVITLFDNYEGWIDSKLVVLISENERFKPESDEVYIMPENLQFILKNGEEMPLVAGSCIFNLKDDGSFKISNEIFKLNELPVKISVSGYSIVEHAMKFINAPYLWGGRTILGMDCSGLTQLVYKIVGISLPRDASQQIELGRNISFISEAETGDLAFFDNEEGRIIHVGILINSGKIIHASGCVRVDSIDHQGIFNKDLGKYTHRLRMIKRLL